MAWVPTQNAGAQTVNYPISFKKIFYIANCGHSILNTGGWPLHLWINSYNLTSVVVFSDYNYQDVKVFILGY